MDLKELEEIWHSRVADAKSLFDLARSHTNTVVRDFPLAEIGAEGRDAYRSAIRLENAALSEFNRITRIYANLIHWGIVPDENEWQRNKATGGTDNTD